MLVGKALFDPQPEANTLKVLGQNYDRPLCRLLNLGGGLV
jgi:hypothetical protein